ncbi:MAG: putative signal transducing protein [Cytophagales bacterium]
MKNEDWSKIYTTSSVAQALIIKDILEQNEIVAVVLNKKDSSYNNFGNCEIFVKPASAETASGIINENFSTQ